VSKRIFDLTVGTLLALVATPLILAFAVALAVTLRAWPFFLQERVGQYGKPFRILKLRTLPSNTPRYALKSSLDFSKLPKVARFLRRTHLDELPQLYCVLAGRMSLVGPRPKMPDDHEPVDPAYAAVRQSVRQGCTGLWQIGRDADGLPHEAPEYDYFYLQNRTLLMDLWILVHTALVVSRLSEGVSLDATPAWAMPTGVTLGGLETLTPAAVMGFDSNRSLSGAEAA
jgi:lipopolysaccharide/colanic/teichoic acid biosynthesis glycosyltransferase